MKTGRSAVFCGVSLSVAGEEGRSSRLERGSGHRHLCDLVWGSRTLRKALGWTVSVGWKEGVVGCVDWARDRSFLALKWLRRGEVVSDKQLWFEILAVNAGCIAIYWDKEEMWDVLWTAETWSDFTWPACSCHATEITLLYVRGITQDRSGPNYQGPH